LLRQKLPDGDAGYLSGESVQVEFPNGDKGVFVTLAYGIHQGFQLLYRIHDDGAELVSLTESVLRWGKLEFLELSLDTQGQPEQLLKVTGSCGCGTGIGILNGFEIIRITDQGFKVIFRGQEMSHAFGASKYLSTTEYRYEYVDLNEDGTTEIIEKGELCYYEDDLQTKTRCVDIQRVYQLYNKTEYREIRYSTPQGLSTPER
jgi:hypothetical protein